MNFSEVKMELGWPGKQLVESGFINWGVIVLIIFFLVWSDPGYPAPPGSGGAVSDGHHL